MDASSCGKAPNILGGGIRKINADRLFLDIANLVISWRGKFAAIWGLPSHDISHRFL
jgi:hypothetical protein